MHLKINGTYALHLESLNVLPQKCLNSSSYFCSALRAEGIYCAFVDPIVFLAGCFCNPITSYILLFRMGKLNRNLVFLACLSIADLIKLLQIPLSRFPIRGLPFVTNGMVGWNIYSHSQTSCWFYRWFHTNAGILVVGVFIVASLDRLFSLTWPERMAQVTTKQAWLIMALTVMVSVGIALSWAVDVGITYDAVMKRYKCWRRHDSNQWSIAGIFVYHGRILPLLIITIVNVVLMAKIFSIMRRRKKLQEGQKDVELKLSQISPAIVVASQAMFNLIVNMMRATTIFVIVFAQIQGDNETAQIAWPFMTFGIALTDIPGCIRWMFYMWRMPVFRSNFLAIIRCRSCKN